MKFITTGDRYKWVQRDSTDRSLFHKNALRDAQFLEKFPQASTSPTVTSIENCARFCLLSSSCDMFYFNAGQCKLHVNERRKMQNLYEIVEEHDGPTGAVYVLHCSPAMENFIVNSDHYGRTLQRKNFFIC